jgi:hypothetical protein
MLAQVLALPPRHDTLDSVLNTPMAPIPEGMIF